MDPEQASLAAQVVDERGLAEAGEALRTRAADARRSGARQRPTPATSRCRTVADVDPLATALADHFSAERLVTLGWSGFAPFDAEGLDFLAGMGEDNLAEYGAAVAGPRELADVLAQAGAELSGVTAADVVAAFASLLADVHRRDVARGAMDGGVASPWVLPVRADRRERGRLDIECGADRDRRLGVAGWDGARDTRASRP